MIRGPIDYLMVGIFSLLLLFMTTVLTAGILDAIHQKKACGYYLSCPAQTPSDRIIEVIE